MYQKLLIGLTTLTLLACDRQETRAPAPRPAPPISVAPATPSPAPETAKADAEVPATPAPVAQTPEPAKPESDPKEAELKRQAANRDAIARIEALERKVEGTGISFQVGSNQAGSKTVTLSYQRRLAEKNLSREEIDRRLSLYFRGLGAELRSGAITDPAKIREFKLKQQLIFEQVAPLYKRSVSEELSEKLPGFAPFSDLHGVWDPARFEEKFDANRAEELVSRLKSMAKTLKQAADDFNVDELVTQESIGKAGKKEDAFREKHADLLNGAFFRSCKARAERIQALLASIQGPVTKPSLQIANAKLARRTLEAIIAPQEKNLEGLGWKILVNNGLPRFDEKVRDQYVQDHRFETEADAKFRALKESVAATTLLTFYQDLSKVLSYTQDPDVRDVEALLMLKSTLMKGIVENPPDGNRIERSEESTVSPPLDD